MTTKPVTMLLVDDDDIDVNAVRRSFDKLGIGNPMVVASDGLEALALLRGGEDGRPKWPEPTIVILDLNMPKMDGFEFLDELRADPKLRPTVVFVLTTSGASEDRRACYERNVAGYMLKHQAGTSFLESMAMLGHFARVVELPA
jgi:CheY-like chemotaxis protein